MNISHFTLQNSNNEKGFTLIELLASTVVIVTVGFIIVTIIVSSLRGTNKSNTITTARQNGTYAIGQISKMLRFARSIDAVNGDTAINCITNAPLPLPQNAPDRTSITFTNLDGGVTTLACKTLTSESDSPMTIASISGTLTSPTYDSLLDTSAVQIPSGMCTITCNQSTASDALIVGISFSLETVSNEGVLLLPEFKVASNPLEFNTSVILRNVGR